MYQKVSLDALGDLTGKHILEIGCGTGQLAIAIAERGASVLAIDICPEMIKYAKKNAALCKVTDRVQFQVVDFEELDISSKRQFDWIIAITVFEYSVNPEKWLTSMHSLGNKFISTFPSDNLIQIVIRRINNWIAGSFPLRFYSEAEVSELLIRTRWKIHDQKNFGPTLWIHARPAEN